MSWLDRSLDFFDTVQLIDNLSYNCKIELHQKTSAKLLVTNENAKILLVQRSDGDFVAKKQKAMAVATLLLENKIQ